ncbi:putative clathrin assembly protein At4g25940 [Miscanthus floridulus]|uniref:putative clathrin assembly protein At4g25940 n=1 Tax=Miscanthus floridulus TaxID=154761 RepID=UPI00345A850C
MTPLSMESNLGGGFDKLTLDSLYDDGTYRQMQQQQLYGSAPPNPFMASDPFAVSNQVAPPASVQMAAMAPQPQHLPMMIEANPFGPTQQHHAGIAPAANPFLDAGFGAFSAVNGMHPQTSNWSAIAFLRQTVTSQGIAMLHPLHLALP